MYVYSEVSPSMFTATGTYSQVSKQRISASRAVCTCCHPGTAHFQRSSCKLACWRNCILHGKETFLFLCIVLEDRPIKFCSVLQHILACTFSRQAVQQNLLFINHNIGLFIDCSFPPTKCMVLNITVNDSCFH